MTAPVWAPIEDDTADLLSLVADDPHPSVDTEWTAWLAAVRTVAAPDGRVDPNSLRREVRGYFLHAATCPEREQGGRQSHVCKAASA